MRTRVVLVVALVLQPGWSTAADFKLTLPAGLQENAAQIPDDNPVTPAKVALGKKFFWDKRWSASATVACVSCHRPDHGWSDSRAYSPDFAGRPSPRHTPTIINRLFSDQQHWSGVRPSLEDQAGMDVNKTDEKVMQRLGAIAAYRAEFRAVFGREFDPAGVAQAVAAYVAHDPSRPATGARCPNQRSGGSPCSRARRCARAVTRASTSPARAIATSVSA